jgi:hypothetical protein
MASLGWVCMGGHTGGRKDAALVSDFPGTVFTNELAADWIGRALGPAAQSLAERGLTPIQKTRLTPRIALPLMVRHPADINCRIDGGKVSDG